MLPAARGSGDHRHGTGLGNATVRILPQSRPGAGAAGVKYQIRAAGSRLPDQSRYGGDAGMREHEGMEWRTG